MSNHNLRPWFARLHPVVRVTVLTLSMLYFVPALMVAGFLDGRKDIADLYRDAWNH